MFFHCGLRAFLSIFFLSNWYFEMKYTDNPSTEQTKNKIHPFYSLKQRETMSKMKTGLTEFGKIIILRAWKTKYIFFVEKKSEKIKMLKCIFGGPRETLKNRVFGFPKHRMSERAHIPPTGGLNRSDTLWSIFPWASVGWCISI